MSRHHVKVISRAKQNSVVERNGLLVVRVTAPANDGKANTAVRKLLAAYWQVPYSRVSIVRGAHQPLKVIARP